MREGHPHPRTLAAIAIGGGIGSVARYGVSYGWATQERADPLVHAGREPLSYALLSLSLGIGAAALGYALV
jgi:fluoride ion exporter CrcB/FEX